MDQSVTQNQVKTSVRFLLFFAGAWLADHHYIPANDVNDLVSALLVIGPLVWAWLDNIIKARQARIRDAVAVQAGINLTTSGKALASDGKTILTQNGGTTPPLPVTVQTGQQIIKDLGPAAATVSTK